MTKRKTIGFTINSLNAGGAERVMTSLANELVTKYDVILITLTKCNPFYKLNSNIKLLTCDMTIAQKQNKLDATRNQLKTIKKISKIVKHESIDLLIGFTTSVNVLTIIAAKLNNLPVIISERNNPIVDPPNKYWKLLRNFWYKYANYLIVQTSPNKEFFSKIMPVKKIAVIKNPIAPSLTSKRVFSKNNKNNKIILTVGRLDANKSQDLLINAFSNISKKNDWVLKLIGEGEKMDAYKKIAHKLKIMNRVFFLGNVKNIQNYYNEAEIFVFTSKSEGYPNALAEALYFGIPCISTDCPNGPSDLISQNNNGILIPVDDLVALENALNRLMSDSKLRSKFSNNALRIGNKLDMKIIINSWVDLINKSL